MKRLLNKIWNKLRGKPLAAAQEPVEQKNSRKAAAEPARQGEKRSPRGEPEHRPGGGGRKPHRQHDESRRHHRSHEEPRRHQRSDDSRNSWDAEKAPAGVAWSPDLFVVPPAEGKTRFHDLGLPDELLHAVADLEFKYCTPIQAAILPHLLQGRDAAGRAQTGTGKTAAFLLQILTQFLRNPLAAKPRNGTPRALVLSPTRELALQIGRDAADLSKYTPFKTLTVYGGTEYEKQKNALKNHVIDIVVATPGRLLDFQRTRVLDLRHVEILVIDEADRMLDMGFIPDVSSIIRYTPPKENRQTLLFSATLSESVMKLASRWQRDPVKVEIEPEQVAVDTVKQIFYLVTSEEKLAMTINIITSEKPTRTLIFGNRRDETEHLMKELRRFGVKCALLSGAVPQNVRTRTLEEFRDGRTPVLVATGVASRGLHIDDVTHVINFNIPDDPEDYVHRIGRTGRAGEAGTSITFACEDESFKLPDIEKYLGREIKCTFPEESMLVLPEPKEGPRSTTVMRPPGSMGGPPISKGGYRGGRGHGGRRGGGHGRSRR